MTLSKLVRRGLWFHRASNLAVLLGVAVATAVLTGALLVGDSLRGSLRERALRQLAGVHYAMVPGRFFHERLLSGKLGTYNDAAIILASIATTDPAGGDPRRLPVTVVAPSYPRVIGVRMRLAVVPEAVSDAIVNAVPALQDKVITGIAEDEAWVSPALAAAMRVRDGDAITIHVPRSGNVPRESALGRKNADDLTVSLKLQVKVEAHDPLVDFDLSPTSESPRAVLVNRPRLATELQESGRVNAALVFGDPRGPLDALFAEQLLLTDYGLSVRSAAIRAKSEFERLDADHSGALEPRDYRRRLADTTVTAADANADKSLTRDELLAHYRSKAYFALESSNLYLPPAAERAAADSARTLGLRFAPTVTYLANAISDGANEIPYSVIAALDASQPPPLGPFVPAGTPPLADDEILLADWPDSPLTAKPGDKITVRYFLPESEGTPVETTATFRLRAKIPMTGPAADPDLTPAFPGITDKLTLGEWDPPFPYDNKRITRRDEEYWDRYRITPKAYITLDAGRRLFGSRFGVVTSIRFAPSTPDRLEADAAAFEKKLLETLNPADFGFVFEDVRARALAASQGGTDFGWLFVGFSFYLIAAALMLVVLLVRLNVDRRAGEAGLLFAAGYRPATVRRLWLAEGLIIALAGGLLGLAFAVGYAWLMLRLLAAMWPEGQVGSFLELHVTPASLAIGYVAAVVMSGLAVAWALRALKQVAPAMLLRGEVVTPEEITSPRPARLWPAGLFAVVGAAAAFAGHFLHGHEARAGAFFAGGAALLTAGLLALRWWLRSSDRAASKPAESVATLGVRNAARNPTRSLLTAGLLAAAAFLLVAVESFRRSPEADFGSKTGGSGGFALVATTDLPLFQDLNDAESGRREALDALEREYQKDPATKAARLDAARDLLAQSTFLPLRVRAGDDAGCRNLYQPSEPRLLGVPRRMIERGGFAIAKTLADSPEEKANPWRLLDRDPAGGVPVFADATSAQWILKKSLGDTLVVTDTRGEPVTLRIVGLLRDSIFQGELVMAESQFLRIDPQAQGYGMLLAEAPAGRADELRTILETAFADRGLIATPAVERLRSYLAVENTYLSTFQVLGGFGLLLGVCGLAVVMLRTAAERRGELALLRAVGFRASALSRMVLAENLFLMVAGLLIGVLAAIVAVVPPILAGEPAGGDLLRTATFLAAVVIAGLAVGALVTRQAARAPVVAALRGE